MKPKLEAKLPGTISKVRWTTIYNVAQPGMQNYIYLFATGEYIFSEIYYFEVLYIFITNLKNFLIG